MTRKHDSSLTRVCPAFQVIGKSANNINAFFHLFKGAKSLPELKAGEPYKVCYNDKEHGNSERVLLPSPSRLRWLVEHSETLTVPKKSNCKTETADKRKKFIDGKLKTEVQAFLKAGNLPRWLVFEGATHPDVFIETDSFIAVGEGKRTEQKLTTSTTWCKERDQLIRHVDALLDMREGKSIYSFFIVEDTSLYEQSLKQFKSRRYFRENLLHRNENEIGLAFNSYLGVLTWADLKRTFPEIAYCEQLN